jgi:uncharacterized protein YjiS (DUF1127 family)
MSPLSNARRGAAALGHQLFLSSPATLGTLAAFVAKRSTALLRALGRTHDRWHQQRRLMDLDDHLLRDIGLTREQAEREARRPFWRLPEGLP